MTAQEIRNKQHEIKIRIDNGENYNKLKVEFQPILDEMNKKGKSIASKFGKKFNKFKFEIIIR
jgi:hypothetical protein